MEKKINIEELVEKIRSIREDFEVSEENPENVILKGNEINLFAEELMNKVKDFIKTEVQEKEDEYDFEDDFEEDDDYFFDDDVLLDEDLD